jgi:phospholipid transport system substrate-binding protein
MTGYARAAAEAAHTQAARLIRTSFLLVSVLLAAGLIAPGTRPVAAAEPTTSGYATPDQVVAAFHASLVHAMKDATYQGRYDELTPVMNRAFDFQGMTRIATGPSWYNLQRAQQDALVDAFRRFSIATYASQFDQYSGERFETTGPSTVAPQGMIVQTVMRPASGDPIKFNYLLHRTAGGWRIIDIYLEGTISQLALRRSEFTSVLAQSGPDGLTHLLDQKAKRLAMM